MTRQEAIRECQRYVQQHNTGVAIEFKGDPRADKDDMFWEVRGATQIGGYRCTVDAVKHEAFTAVYETKE